MVNALLAGYAARGLPEYRLFHIVLIVLFVVAMSFVIPAVEASAQGRIGGPVCGPRGGFIQFFANRHNETPTSMGLASNGKMVEVLTSEKGSWTIVVTDPHGRSCVVATGEAWQNTFPTPSPKAGT